MGLPFGARRSRRTGSLHSDILWVVSPGALGAPRRLWGLWGTRQMTTGNLDLDTFPKLLLHHSRERGERPAIREKSRGIWRTMTWRELAEEAAALAAALHRRGAAARRACRLHGRQPATALCGDVRGAMAGRHRRAAVPGRGGRRDGVADPERRTSPTSSPRIRSRSTSCSRSCTRCPTVRCIVYDKDRGMRHYKQPQLISYAALLQQGRELAAAKRDFLQAEAARGSGQDAACLFFTSGTTGPAKGVVLTHAALIDRARVAAAMDGLNDTDVAMAYLPPAWIGQHLFGYAQPMVVAIASAVPNRPRPCLPICARSGRPISWRRRACSRRCSPRYRSGWRMPAASMQRLHRHCMAVAARVGCAHPRRRAGIARRSARLRRRQSADLRPAARRARA